MTRDEQWFRNLLDEDGVLRADADLGLDERSCFRVFSQDSAPKIRSAKWAEFAKRFTDTRVGITTDKRYGVRDVVRDAARVVLARDTLRATRLVIVRAATDADVSRAEAGERASGTYGLSVLARRCKTVFLVETQAAHDERDEAPKGQRSVASGASEVWSPDQDPALLLCAILAGTELGPIVAPDASDIFGFKTAWTRFSESKKDAPYR